jgi:hypothetical protein
VSERGTIHGSLSDCGAGSKHDPVDPGKLSTQRSRVFHAAQACDAVGFIAIACEQRVERLGD